MQLQRLFQVLESLFFTSALAGYIDFQALSDIPIPFAPDRRGEWSFHVYIVSQSSRISWHALSCVPRTHSCERISIYTSTMACVSAMLI